MGPTVPVTPRLCLLGDQTELPNVQYQNMTVVINVGVVTAVQMILRLWKSLSPDLKQWIDSMLEILLQCMDICWLESMMEVRTSTGLGTQGAF